MNKNVFTMFYVEPYGLHHTLTFFCTVTWVDIYVLTPEALWTVVSVSVAFYEYPALSTCEVLNVALEFFVHCSAPVVIYLLSRSMFNSILIDSILLDIFS